MMPLADLAQLAIAGKNRVADRRRIVVGESIILAGDDGDGHGALQVSAGRAASAVLPCPQALPRLIARFAERRSGCGPQFRHRTPEAQGRGGLVAHGTGAGACERAMTRDGTVGRSDATERSLPFHWDIDPARMMRPRFADSIRASSPSGLREQAGHTTATGAIS